MNGHILLPAVCECAFALNALLLELRQLEQQVCFLSKQFLDMWGPAQFIHVGLSSFVGHLSE